MKSIAVLLLLGCVWGSPLPDAEDEGDVCGYKSCPATSPDVLNVHIVPHTHDDVGWLKTVDQYYFGSKNFIQKAGVQYILDSVIKELWEDPARRFIYVETAFFWKWWTKQKDSMRQKVQQLVQQGRLEFIGGAWSMNDEAATHYQSTIDQLTWGLRKLNDTFGACGRPRIGWQIDPFGHSRELASILALMGYDGLFHGRIDYQDKIFRQANGSMEMLWRGNDDLGEKSDIFTGILYNTYSPPAGFCFDILCNDEPIIDEPDSPDYNVDRRISTFLSMMDTQRKRVNTTNNLIVTMGGDFTYMDATSWYTNLDRLIEYTNQKSNKEGLKVKLLYSTPSCYLKAVHEANPQLPTKQDDFFPYASDPNSYWTGYFTSRPTIKYFEREGNNYLQMVKQLQVLAKLADHNKFVLDELKSAMGIMQHHDAVTGTEKQHVANDYARILDEAIEDALTIARQGFSKIISGDEYKISQFTFDRCPLNISTCAVSEASSQFMVTIYNGLSWSVSPYVRIPVTGDDFVVYDSDGKTIKSQLADIPASVINLPYRSSNATQELVFYAENLPPIGFKNYYIQATHKQTTRESSKKITRSLKQRKMTKSRVFDTYFVNENDQKIMNDDYLERYENHPFKSLYNHDYYPERIINIKTIIDSKEIDINNIPKILQNEPNSLENEEIPLNGENNPEEFEEKKLHKSMENINTRERKQNLESMTEDELRMLGDDPMVVDSHSDDYFIENEHIQIKIDPITNKIIDLTIDDKTIDFDISFYYYEGYEGNNEIPQNRSSGAYIFRPIKQEPILINRSEPIKIIKGDLVQEIHLKYNFSSYALRLYKGLNIIEVDWLVGPIPTEDKIGKEIVIRYATNLHNNDVFYTDSNGRSMLKRILNKRPQWNLTINEPTAGNYYPVTKRIYLEDTDENMRFSVINDRAQGGSVLKDGEIELMLHRRLLVDDAFGVGEALDEKAFGNGLVARGTHYLHLSSINGEESNKNNVDLNDNVDTTNKNIVASIKNVVASMKNVVASMKNVVASKKNVVASNKIFEKQKTIEYQITPHIFVSDAKHVSLQEWKALKNKWSGLKTDSNPFGLNILTLEPWRGDTLLLRLENYLEKADLGENNGKITVNINGLLNGLKITKCTETALGANLWLKDKNRLKWLKKTEFLNATLKDSSQNVDNENSCEKIDIIPMDIRTFIVQYSVV